MKSDIRDIAVLLVAIFVAFLFVFAIGFGCAYIDSMLKARAYNRATGANISAFDAMGMEIVYTVNEGGVVVEVKK